LEIIIITFSYLPLYFSFYININLSKKKKNIKFYINNKFKFKEIGPSLKQELYIHHLIDFLVKKALLGIN